MKKGSSKKILFGITSALFVLLTLLAPNYNNSKIEAQTSTCTALAARFEPATINGEVDEKFMDEWYTEGNPPSFKVIVALNGCKGKLIGVSIVEEDGASINDNVNIDTASKKVVTTVYSAPVVFDASTLTFNFVAGSSECEAEIGPDCDLHFNIEADNTRIYSSVASDKTRAQGGSLDYDEGDNVWVNFKYKNVDEEEGDKVGTRWFYKLTSGKYVMSGDKTSLNTKLDCEKEAEGTAAAEKPANCTDSPELDKVVGGTLNGISSIVPHCELGNIPACVTDIIYSVVFVPLSFLAGLAGQFFDLLFSFSISSEIYGGGGADIGFLKVAWTFIRDICNLGFILTLLWISILQILTPTKYNAKKQIPGIIIIALLINFSYFFGTIIIDATNVLARFLYTNDAICVNTAGVCDGSISEGIIAAFNPQTMIDKSSDAFLKATGQETMNVEFYAIILILSIWASWKMFMMFFKIGTVFLGRIVQLWVHLVLSPVAFINMILPKKIKSGSIKEGPIPWAEEFFKNAFIAPLFMFFMYLIFLMLSKFDVAKVAFASHGHGAFLVILTMIFPFFVITMLMDSAIDYTTKQAGSIAGKITSMINGAIGAVAGTALALGGGAVMGAVVKGGGAVLGKLGKGLVGREGKGLKTGFAPLDGLSRGFNSKVAKMGGRVNQYSKDLPNKNFDIRKSKLGGVLKDATGFDVTTGQGEINKWLKRGGLRPDENYTQREKRKDDEKIADIERRKVVEKTDKTDRELGGVYAKREASLNKALEKERAKGKPNFNEAEFTKRYKEKTSGTEELFNAKTGKEYTKAAQGYNKKVRQDFIEKKKRNVYGRKNTQENYENHKQVGFADRGDLLGAGGKAVGLGTLASAVGAGTGIGLAAGILYADNAKAERESDISFLRKMEKEDMESLKKEKTKKKTEAEIEKFNNLIYKKESELEDLSKNLKDLSSSLKQNSKTFTDVSGLQVKSFKQLFEETHEKITRENGALPKDEQLSEANIEYRAINETNKEFRSKLEETQKNIKTALETVGDDKARKDELETEWLKAEYLKEEINKDKTSYDSKSIQYEKTLEATDKHRKTRDKLRESTDSKPADKKDDKKDAGGDKKDEKK